MPDWILYPLAAIGAVSLIVSVLFVFFMWSSGD